jgi:DNA-binding FrmR family transcriptional regulator
MEPRQRGIEDRQLDALLERLDAIRDELRSINRRLDSQDTLLRMTAEIAALNESLQALAYAALGQQAPQVRRRRTG